MDFFELGYLGLFIAAFLSATIIPLSSEFVFAALILNNYDPSTSIIVATIGNSLGSLTNYWIGLLGNPRWLHRFGVSEEKILNFQQRIKKYGIWLGLVSWVPFIGDPLTVACGYFRVHFYPFIILTVFAKFLRYLILYLFFI